MSEIQKKAIEQEVSQSYLDYAMSVIVGRALPDIRDGLKPVHRRILYSMYELSNFYDKPYKKSARIVGEVLGKYHPHGDLSIYSSLVRMAQDFSMRYPLIDGQGNFGSIDGDNPAAMRYTEVKLQKIASEMLEELDKETVEFIPNFDGTLKEPVVLPSKIPNLLINGSSGIAVGMATNIPPHNLGEVCDALIYLIKNPNATVEELFNFILGPDFPTGGKIVGKSKILQAYKLGKGTITIQGKTQIIEDKNKKLIKITEIPFGVNKSSLVMEIATLVKEKRLEGIVDILDLSNKEGIEIVIYLKKDVDAKVVLSNLYAKTQLQSSFGIINLALVDGEPKILTLKELLEHFINFRREIITKRTKYELKIAEERKHVLDGLLVALKNLDFVLSLIKNSKDSTEAKNKLVENYELSQKQAESILEMKLSKLTSLEQEKIQTENLELIKLIEKLKEILANKNKIDELIVEELNQIKQKYQDPRRTSIIEQEDEITYTDLIPDETVAIILTEKDYIKSVSISEYKTQKRGGKGIVGTETKENDILKDILIARTHDTILFFTAKGLVHWLEAYKIPRLSRYSVGKPIINLLEIEDDKISAMIALREFKQEQYLLMITKNGMIKRTSILEYSKPRRGGIRAIKLEENDQLIAVLLSSGESDIFIATEKGYCIRFQEKEIRQIGRVAKGVRAISLREGDRVVSASLCNKPTILTVCENGYGKRTALEEYRVQGRGGYGIINIKTTPRNGNVISSKAVSDENEFLLISSNNHAIRLEVKNISIISRNTQGVRLMKLDENEKIVAMQYFEIEEDKELNFSSSDSNLEKKESKQI
ncbi:MAG: DNA gyrase subunit A [Candidatus Micrarchaeota archaeon]|nr:DNA gyrase subunit A [Candidatus Micrarchaeota archaeon]